MRRVALLTIAMVVMLLGVTPAGSQSQSTPSLQLARSEAGHVYGAIAYSKANGGFGFSTRYGNSESANEAALEECAKHGRGCYVVISFSNLCASVVADDEGGVFWGTAGTRLEAQRQALFYCKRDGDPATCAIKSWACSFP